MDSKIRDNLLNRFRHMKSRCYNKNDKGYKNYGAKGILICDEWLEDPIKFVEWAINNGYSPELSIDRVNTFGNYEPNNCRWITIQEQQNNKRNTVYITAFGETKTLKEWSEDTRCKISRKLLWSVYKSGTLSPEECITYDPKDIRTFINTHDGEKALLDIYKDLDFEISMSALRSRIKNGTSDPFRLKSMKNTKLTAFNETKTIKDWILDDRCVVKSSAIRKRLKEFPDMPHEIILTKKRIISSEWNSLKS